MGRIGILPFVIESRNCEKLPHRDNEYNWGAPRIVLWNQGEVVISVIRNVLLALLVLSLASVAWAQWSSDPNQHLALSNISGADQVQPKVLPLPNNSWHVSWF